MYAVLRHASELRAERGGRLVVCVCVCARAGMQASGRTLTCTAACTSMISRVRFRALARTR
ncbi:hypothetical protein EON67_10535 [archaeon]|nr:MAG: hypothetical protein EON67_10535 [archaeon]